MPVGFIHSPHAKMLAMIVAVPVLVVWISSTSDVNKEGSSSAVQGSGLQLFQELCVVEWQNMAIETGTPWKEGSADMVCLCLGSRYLLQNKAIKTEEDQLKTVEAMTSNTELFRSFLLLDKVISQCIP